MWGPTPAFEPENAERVRSTAAQRGVRARRRYDRRLATEEPVRHLASRSLVLVLTAAVVCLVASVAYIVIRSEERADRALHAGARQVDLESLAARVRPRDQGGTWESVFEDLLALRDRPTPAAVPVLADVMRQERGSSRIFRYAAAQALWAIGSREAAEVLEEESSRADFDGRLAFDYAFHWNMAPALRDGFLARHVLRNAGEAPTLTLRVPTGVAGDQPRLEFDVEVRNDLPRPLEIMDPRDRDGEMLVFRQVGGHYARTQWPATCEHMKARAMTLAPGASQVVRITVDLVRADALREVQPGWAPPEGVAGRSGGYVYLLGTRGDYDVVARWTSRAGRSVSDVVRVGIPAVR